LKTILPVALALGILLSPEVFTVLGNASGYAGMWIPVFMLLAGIVYAIIACAYDTQKPWYFKAKGEVKAAEFRVIQRFLGVVPALLLPVLGRVTVAICLSTILLATAGYVFNEVFVYWFPNLGFSFCLLGILVLVNIFGNRTSAWAQYVFTGCALGAILFLTMTGLFGLGNDPLQAFEGSTPTGHLPEIMVPCLLVFLGTDLAVYSGEAAEKPVKAMMTAILLMGFIYAAWGWVTGQYVAPNRLIDTSIPHVKVARAVLGQNGRIIMGIVIISGSAAAVNALLMAVSRMLGTMALEGWLPRFLAAGKSRTRVGTLVLGAGIAAMMASGMAGEPILEIYAKAGIGFWLLLYGAFLISVLVIPMKTARKASGKPAKTGNLWFVLALIAILLAIAGIFLLATERALLLKTMLVMGGIGLAVAIPWIYLSNKKGWLKKVENDHFAD
jgi:amino acid transporter